jgi:hypothetical protein
MKRIIVAAMIGAISFGGYLAFGNASCDKIGGYVKRSGFNLECVVPLRAKA